MTCKVKNGNLDYMQQRRSLADDLLHKYDVFMIMMSAAYLRRSAAINIITNTRMRGADWITRIDLQLNAKKSTRDDGLYRATCNLDRNDAIMS